MSKILAPAMQNEIARIYKNIAAAGTSDSTKMKLKLYNAAGEELIVWKIQMLGEPANGSILANPIAPSVGLQTDEAVEGKLFGMIQGTYELIETYDVGLATSLASVRLTSTLIQENVAISLSSFRVNVPAQYVA